MKSFVVILLAGDIVNIKYSNNLIGNLKNLPFWRRKVRSEYNIKMDLKPIDFTAVSECTGIDKIRSSDECSECNAVCYSSVKQRNLLRR
jgi:hypothetical protein